ncbi:hypothetical protein Vdis_2136 [Vulcanisaeta distributa DSM 14429]|uniref:PilT protein domain protein n=1 Tax=Vulcanisaeta distributa (strain DSM 14429 / JCM 11212 / NBRC 100878 / IC-017) TaxID=572478 RepID=E1QPU5_VULDI|nr:hypothetical protein Vdis_2136 [Vulcanisaeta distributa DSM 14429]
MRFYEILRLRSLKIIHQDIYFVINHKDYIKHYDYFNDLLILSAALRLNLPLITFDEELLNLYNKLSHKLRS